jgi:pSer/pThr/pTyr-binding forkhead associated (FHA) protein
MPCLIIEKGEPYEMGKIIPLQKKTITVGRISGDFQPDIAFANSYISRKHLSIKYEEGHYLCADRDSTNGTKLNNDDLEKDVFVTLKNGDRIILAKSDALIVYSDDFDLETQKVPQVGDRIPVSFNDERRELTINNRSITLTGNLYALFIILYVNRGKGVSHDEIRKAVWTEREKDYNGIPIATEEEIMTNIMRLRKKFQEYPYTIKTLRGFGYLLDMGMDIR